MAVEGKDVAELRAKFLEVLGRVGKISVAADELRIGYALGRSWAREAGFEPVRGRRHCGRLVSIEKVGDLRVCTVRLSRSARNRSRVSARAEFVRPARIAIRVAMSAACSTSPSWT
jgi:hypothetical protein